MRKRRWVHGAVSLLVVAVLVAAGGCGLMGRRGSRAPGMPGDYAYKGKGIQQLQAFDNPESAVFSADGKFVFVTNAAELGMKRKGFHWIECGGFVSKLAVQPDGTLKMVKPKLLDGLTGPLGMAVNTKATNTFPEGTIFVCTGNLPMAEADGAPIAQPSRHQAEIIGFDADGKPLGAISWGKGSVLTDVSRAPATQPNGMAFDKDGNLYIAETGMGGDSLKPPIKSRPGVMMIPHGALDDLAAGKSPAEKPLFVPMPGGPDGVAVCPSDQTIHVNTVGAAAGMADPNKGGMFKLTREDFAKGKCPPAFASGFGALDGLTFLPNSARLDTQVLDDPHYVMVTLPGQRPMRVVMEPDIRFAACADIAVREMADGGYLLVIPQLSPLSRSAMKDEVAVVKLPKEFGTAPPVKPSPATEKAKPEPEKAKPAAPAVKAEPPKPKAEPAPAKPKAEEKKPEPAKAKPEAKKEEKKWSLWPFGKKETAEPKKGEAKPTPAPAAKPVPEVKKEEPKKEEKKPSLWPFGKKEKAEPKKEEAKPAPAPAAKAQPEVKKEEPKKEEKKWSLWPFGKKEKAEPKKEEIKPKEAKPPAAPAKVPAAAAKPEPKKEEPKAKEAAPAPAPPKAPVAPPTPEVKKEEVKPEPAKASPTPAPTPVAPAQPEAKPEAKPAAEPAKAPAKEEPKVKRKKTVLRTEKPWDASVRTKPKKVRPSPILAPAEPPKEAPKKEGEADQKQKPEDKKEKPGDKKE